MKKIILSFLLMSSLAPIKMLAQDNVIDEVIWVVGDESILRSDVERQRLQAEYEKAVLPGDPYCVFPEQMAIQKLYLHQAELDSVVVNETSVLSQVEKQLNYYLSMSGTKEKMEENFKMSTTELREKLREMVKDQQLMQEVQQKLVADIKSTPADVRRYYNQLPTDSIPVVPAQVELQVISFEPPVPVDETNRIKEKLRGFAERVNSGNADFSVLARLYSEDPGTSKQGGELGFFGKGVMAPEFSAVAFNLSDPKKVSRIVQTEFGFHIIQLIEKRGDRINCRHILLKPKVSIEQKNKAIHVLDSVANKIREGKLTFEQAVLMFSQDKNSTLNGGLMLNETELRERGVTTSKFEYQDLSTEIGKIVYRMNVGEVSKPFSMINTSTNKEVVTVVKVKSKTESHKATLSDDYQMLKNMYEGKKKEEFLHNWIIKKQKETYISIDPKWQNCNFQYPGWIKK